MAENMEEILAEYLIEIRRVMGDNVEKLFSDARQSEVHIGGGSLVLTPDHQKAFVAMIRGEEDG